MLPALFGAIVGALGLGGVYASIAGSLGALAGWLGLGAVAAGGGIGLGGLSSGIGIGIAAILSGLGVYKAGNDVGNAAKDTNITIRLAMVSLVTLFFLITCILALKKASQIANNQRRGLLWYIKYPFYWIMGLPTGANIYDTLSLYVHVFCAVASFICVCLGFCYIISGLLVYMSVF